MMYNNIVAVLLFLDESKNTMLINAWPILYAIIIIAYNLNDENFKFKYKAEFLDEKVSS